MCFVTMFFNSVNIHKKFFSLKEAVYLFFRSNWRIKLIVIYVRGNISSLMMEYTLDYRSYRRVQSMIIGLNPLWKGSRIF